ncbi:MAG: DUF21 domain-containing protein, partial [Ignavibacteriaceae bacterium]|nr:DUF21 domain-containing protein [Ignavibacteriaceae bacterium]
MDFFIIDTILLIILVALAGIFSAADIAISSFGSNRIDELRAKNDKSAELFESVQKDPNSFYGAIQIITNLL